MKFISDKEASLLLKWIEKDDNIEPILNKLFFYAFEFSGSGMVDMFPIGDGLSDSIPSRLSVGEFVFTAKATQQLGAENLTSLMNQAHDDADNGFDTLLYTK